MEILTGVERRRRWSSEEKLEILREASAPGSSVGAVARRHEINRLDDLSPWDWKPLQQNLARQVRPSLAAYPKESER